MKSQLKKNEQELISLIQYFENLFTEIQVKHNLTLPPELQTFVEKISAAKDLIKKNTNEPEAEKIDHENRAIKSQNIECPNCKVLKVCDAIAEHINQHGYRCNEYFCDECETGFTDFIPNNPKDLLLWNNNFIEQLMLVQEDGKTMAETLNLPNELVQEAINSRDEIQKASGDVDSKFVELTESEKSYADKIEEYRDQFLVMKLLLNQTEIPKA